MEPGYWQARWREGRIGFHSPRVQPWLIDHAARLLPAQGGRVLVPLCGKSLDLPWLEARGHHVVGIDLAEAAFDAFRRERDRAFEIDAPPALAPFRRWRSGAIELWLGDLFDADPSRHGRFDAIWDRAALIALPPATRVGYARRLLELLTPAGRMGIVTLEYDSSRLEGPPFSVLPDEVARHYAAAGDLVELGAKSILDEEPHFRARGLSALVERCWLFTRS